MLIHSNTGDLLRSLEPPKNCASPKIICMNREGYVVVNFDKGGLCLYGINGKTMKTVEHGDTVQVSSEFICQWLHCFKLLKS